MKVRTRFAPSPTGFMHVGNLRTAIFEYLLAAHSGGKFILRIEDTDQARRVDGAIDFIYDTLKLCNINIDEGPNNEGDFGPYIQSQRLHLYEEYAQKLIENNHAYYCFCSEERLNNLREKCEKEHPTFMYDGHCKKLTSKEIAEKINNGEKPVIRQAMPKEGQSIYNDFVYGQIKVDNNILEDQILLKSDGYPTYNFANVVDDHLMNITHVIRGNEYLMSTAKYNLLYDAFGWDRPEYIHVSMVLGSDGQKLSKRNGDASFIDLYNEGYLPSAIVNYLVMLGWSPASNEEIFTIEELIKQFDPKRINKSASTFDIKKLNWYNAIYLKKMPLNDFVKLVKPFLEANYDLSNKDEEWIKELLTIYQNHISYGKEIIEVTELFFKENIVINEENKEFMESDPLISEVLRCFKKELEALSTWTIESISTAINNTKETSSAKGKILFMPIRIAISGQMHGPELPNTIHLLGKDLVLKRLANQ